MKLDINYIENILNLKTINDSQRQIINIFLEAINDWSTDISTFEEYEVELERFINNETTKNNIENKLKEIDIAKEAWQAESMSQILEVFKFYKENTSLKRIIIDLKINLRVA